MGSVGGSVAGIAVGQFLTDGWFLWHIVAGNTNEPDLRTFAALDQAASRQAARTLLKGGEDDLQAEAVTLLGTEPAGAKETGACAEASAAHKAHGSPTEASA